MTPPLTPLQARILTLRVRGLLRKQIAHEVRLHVSTVQWHCCLINDKVGSRERLAWAQYGIEQGHIAQ